MTTVREREVEDREDRFRGRFDEAVVGDVDPFVGEGGEDADAVRIKGSITADV